MRFIIKATFPTEKFNNAISERDFGERMQKVLKEMKAEAAYFTPIDGRRGGYIVCNINDASQIPAVTEPLFLWADAEIEFSPVMLPEDLAKAVPSIESAVKNWRVEEALV